MGAQECTGTAQPCASGCTWDAAASKCKAALAGECTGTQGACSAGCTWNGTACAASLAQECTAPLNHAPPAAPGMPLPPNARLPSPTNALELKELAPLDAPGTELPVHEQPTTYQ